MEKKEIKITVEKDMTISAENCINRAELIGILHTALYTLLSEAVDKYIEV